MTALSLCAVKEGQQMGLEGGGLGAHITKHSEVPVVSQNARRPPPPSLSTDRVRSHRNDICLLILLLVLVFARLAVVLDVEKKGLGGGEQVVG